MLVQGRTGARIAALLAGALLSLSAARAGSVDIATFHVDPQRTGWNNKETALTWTSVASGGFRQLLSVPLDEQIDAAPLIVSAQTIANAGASGYPNDVVVLATENNTIYEVDSGTGAILRSRNLGTPVAQANLPGGCANNSAVVGVNSTPVIDLSTFSMYVVAYTWENNAPVYRLHKLFLGDLSDMVAPVVVSANWPLSDGTTVAFQAGSQRQRPALLMSQGKVYAAFGSFCDFNTDASRGWLFAWNAATLKLVNAGVSDQQTKAQAGAGLFSGWSQVYYLNSIWMSGYGPAADAYGSVYLNTGNSNGSNVNNFPDSALKVAPNLDALVDYFTPSNFYALDAADNDYGSGGIMVVPDQAGGGQFAVGAGKEGKMFLFNRNHLGGYVAGGPDAPPTVSIGPCWCGPAYFVGSDGKARVVSSGGSQVKTWLVPATAGGKLIAEATSAALDSGSGYDGGFHTFVSSNGTQAGSAIVWAMSHPVNKTVSLVALKADSGLGSLFSAPAGSWVSSANNANIFPVVAGGKVYVASYRQLSVFGLGGSTALPAAKPAAAAAVAPTPGLPAPIGGSRRWGRVAEISADHESLTLTLRGGGRLKVSLTQAVAFRHAAVAQVGEALRVDGAPGSDGVFQAQVAVRAKAEALWGADLP